jgi:hypothetical protein
MCVVGERSGCGGKDMSGWVGGRGSRSAAVALTLS